MWTHTHVQTGDRQGRDAPLSSHKHSSHNTQTDSRHLPAPRPRLALPPNPQVSRVGHVGVTQPRVRDTTTTRAPARHTDRAAPCEPAMQLHATSSMSSQPACCRQLLTHAPCTGHVNTRPECQQWTACRQSCCSTLQQARTHTDSPSEARMRTAPYRHQQHNRRQLATRSNHSCERRRNSVHVFQRSHWSCGRCYCRNARDGQWYTKADDGCLFLGRSIATSWAAEATTAAAARRPPRVCCCCHSRCCRHDGVCGARVWPVVTNLVLHPAVAARHVEAKQATKDTVAAACACCCWAVVPAAAAAAAGC